MPEKNPIPLVSIIMPTYNRADLIIATIKSIKEQIYSNWELIIVDDGSDDNTEEVVTEIKDARIHFIKAGRIGIGGRIKNIGLGKANGEYIAFNDSDDLWDKTKLEKQVAALHDYREAGFCLTGGYNFKNVAEPIDHFYKQREGVRFDNVFTAIFKSEVAVFTQALMIRRSCLDVVGRFKEERSFSDFDFIVSLAKRFKAVILYEPLVFRRLHDENYISSTWEKSYYEGEAMIRKNKDELPAKIYNDALFRLYTNFGESCLRHKESGKAVGKFLTAWKYKPLSLIPFKKTVKAGLQLFNGK
jgi:glycosyltransferase involved in cell wall biosynthesis